MKRKLRSFLQSTSGFSLTEVLIAIVILGIAGITIINGMTTDTKVRGKTNTATNVSVNLNAAAEILLSSNVSLTPCNSTTDDVYTGKINSIPNVTVTKVEALTRETNPTWLTCETSSYANSAAQRITLQSINAGTVMKKIILKTSSTNSTSVATPFSIDASKSTVTIAAQGDSTCGSFDTLNLSNSLGSNSIVYSAISTDPTKISSTTSGSNLTINGLAAGTSSVTIQGINASNGVTSNPITINATVVPAIRFTSPSPQISVIAPYARNISITNLLSRISGGSSSTKQVALRNSSSSFQITSTNSYTFNYAGVSNPQPSGLYDNPVSVTDPGLPNASNCISSSWGIPIKVQPLLSFTLDTSSRCVVGTGTSCSIPVIFVPQTGSGTSITSGSLGTYSSTTNNISIPAQSCGAGVTSFTSNSLSNPGGDLSKIQVTLSGGTYNQFNTNNAYKVSFVYTIGNGQNAVSRTLNGWIVSGYSSSTQGQGSATLTLSAPSGSSEDVSNGNPSSIRILELKPIYPTVTDSNSAANFAGPSYISTSSTLLAQYCN